MVADEVLKGAKFAVLRQGCFYFEKALFEVWVVKDTLFFGSDEIFELLLASNFDAFPGIEPYGVSCLKEPVLLQGFGNAARIIEVKNAFGKVC